MRGFSFQGFPPRLRIRMEVRSEQSANLRSRASTRCVPRRPVAPVTKNFFMKVKGQPSLATNFTNYTKVTGPDTGAGRGNHSALAPDSFRLIRVIRGKSFSGSILSPGSSGELADCACAVLLLHKDRADPLLDPFRVDIDPVIRPVNILGIPQQALPVRIGEHVEGLSNIVRLEDKTVVDHEVEKHVQGLCLLPDLPAGNAQATQIRIHEPVAQNFFREIQRGVEKIKTSMEAPPLRLKLLHADHLGFDIGLP